MIKTKTSMPTSPPITSTPKTANKRDAYAALGEASDTLNFLIFLIKWECMHLSASHRLLKQDCT